MSKKKLEWLKILLRSAIPPSRGASEDELYSWRVVVSTISVVTASVLGLHLVWGVGGIPIGQEYLPARQTEVSALVQEVRRYRSQDLITSLLEMRRAQCGSSGAAKILYTEKITELLEEYYQFHKRSFLLPACSDFEG
jgi:hypothetical protein